jgi:hypothetical protein
MSLENRITVLAQSIAADIKLLKAAQGNLNVLNTTAKTSLVAAINEVLQLPRRQGLRLVQPLMMLQVMINFLLQQDYDLTG